MAILSQIGGMEWPKDLYIVIRNLGQKVKTVYHIHLTENTRFLEDLFWKTKATSAFEDGQIRGVACTLTENWILIVIVSLKPVDFLSTTITILEKGSI